jgi:hypothetical protein
MQCQTEDVNLYKFSCKPEVDCEQPAGVRSFPPLLVAGVNMQTHLWRSCTQWGSAWSENCHRKVQPKIAVQNVRICPTLSSHKALQAPLENTVSIVRIETAKLECNKILSSLCKPFECSTLIIRRKRQEYSCDLYHT